MIRLCQIGILLSINSSLINLKVPIHKNTQTEHKNTNVLWQKQCIIYILNKKKHHNNTKQWSELVTLTTFSIT